VIQLNPIPEESATVEANGIRLHVLHVQRVSRCRLDVAGAYSIASCRRYTCP